MYRLLFSAALAASASAAPQVLGKGPLLAVVGDSPASTVIAGYPVAAGDQAVPTKTPPLATLRIDWLNQTPEPTEFEVVPDAKRSLTTSTHRLGDTHITRTVLVTEEAIYLHFLADKPGDLSFRATLKVPENEKISIEERRELAWTSSSTPATKARVWVIPFESDVETDGQSVVLRGEGECLVVFNFAAAETPGKPVSGTWARTAAALDPGADPPDPSKIWHAILARTGAP